MWKRIVIALLVLSGGPGLASEFIPGFEDVPAMPGLTVDGEASTVFDTTAGRIVEAYAAGDVTAEGVRRFYGDTLPQLGWTRTGPLEFQREGERLTVELIGSGGPLTIRFRLAPVANR